MSTSSLCKSSDDEHREGVSGTSGDLETHVLQLAAEKVKLSKKALWRFLKSRDTEFDVSESVDGLRRHPRSRITKLRKGKQSEWSRNQRAGSGSGRNSHANVTCIGSLSSFFKMLSMLFTSRVLPLAGPIALFTKALSRDRFDNQTDDLGFEQSDDL